MITESKPEVVVVKDYDGYFERLVRSWVERKKGLFHHEKIVVSARPFQSSAIRYTSDDAEKTIYLSFYSALRAGFGQLKNTEVEEMIQLL